MRTHDKRPKWPFPQLGKLPAQIDCAKLTKVSIDFKQMLITFERSKTAVRRVCPLWPETVKALKAYKRPNATASEQFFITKYGKPRVKETLRQDEADKVEKVSYKDSITQELSLHRTSPSAL